MKHFILPIALGLALVSCNRDNDNNAAETPILPVKLVTEAGGIELKYNGDKLTEIIEKDEDVESRSMVEYTGDLITTITSYENNTETGKKSFTYENGRLVKKVDVYIDSQGQKQTDTDSYQYNNDGTITGTNENGRTIIYTMQNGNIIKEIDEQNTRVYKYDTKNNPFKNVRGFSALVLDMEDLGTLNNVMEEVGTHTYQDATLSTFTRVYTYDYNANGYPTKKVMKYTDIDNNTRTGTQTFVYNR